MNIRNFDPDKIKIDETSYRNILINYIRHLRIKDFKYIKVNSVNPCYLIFSKVSGYFGQIDKSKYLKLVPTNESKENLKITKSCGVKSEL